MKYDRVQLYSHDRHGWTPPAQPKPRTGSKVMALIRTPHSYRWGRVVYARLVEETDDRITLRVVHGEHSNQTITLPASGVASMAAYE